MVLGRRSLHLGACPGSSFAAERPRTVPIRATDTQVGQQRVQNRTWKLPELCQVPGRRADKQCAVEPRVLPTVAVQGRRAKKAEAREGAPEAPVVDRG